MKVSASAQGAEMLAIKPTGSHMVFSFPSHPFSAFCLFFSNFVMSMKYFQKNEISSKNISLFKFNYIFSRNAKLILYVITLLSSLEEANGQLRICSVVGDCQYHIVCGVTASWGRQIKHHRILIPTESRLERDTSVGVQIQGKNKANHFLEQGSDYLSTQVANFLL